jgi:hypothetical protein
MSKYPLEWGWHDQPETTKTSATSDSVRETLLGRKPREDGEVDIAAVGDRLCVNHPKKSGQTGAYEIRGLIFCRDCAVKKLGFENLPSDEQTKAMIPWCLDPK